MKHLFLLFNFALLSLHSYSQVENFDISKYKLPDIKRQQLDFSFNSAGENSSTFLIYESENLTDTLKRDNNTFLGGGNLAYSYYRNTRRIQANVNASIYGSYSKSKHDGNNIYGIDRSDINNSLSFVYDLKYFFEPKNWFVTTEPVFNYSYMGQKNNLTENNWKNVQTTGSLKIGGGKGRIEQVQDFRHAVLLIQEFEKRGVSNRNVTENEIIELSTLISELKNRRFFDYRKQKQAELVALDSFFVNTGIIDEKGISYFVGLEDIWSFGGLQIRESGKQIMLSFTPEYYYQNSYNKEDEKKENANENLSLNFNLGFVSKNPISLKWQADYEGGIRHTYYNQLQQRNDNTAEKIYESNAYLNGQVGYYPNTRTNFNLNGNLSLGNRSDEIVFDNEKYSAAFQIATSGYYYISERLRLGYTVRYSGSEVGIFNNEVENTYHKSLNYTLNFNYAIF